MSTPVWNIETNSDLTAESGSAAGHTTFPPETAAARLTDRAGASYPVLPSMATPTWYLDTTGTATPGGKIGPRHIQLFWHSNTGAIPAGSLMPPLTPTASADPNNKGSKGLDSIGISGHNIYINGGTNPSYTTHGPQTTVGLTGYWSQATPPVWVPLAPSTTYTITVQPFKLQPGINGLTPGTAILGTKSASLSVTTPAATTTTQQVTTNPGPPGGVTLTAPLPVITSTAGGPISLTWNRIAGATSYEVWDNNTLGDTLVLDPSNPGFFIGDTRIVASVSQPALPATQVTVNTPNYTAPSLPVRIKVRAVKTDSNGTAYSAFSPTMYATIPAALNIPAVPAAPTVAFTGHNALVTVVPGTVSSSFGPAAFYNVYDGAKFITQLTAPTLTTHIIYSGAGVAYSITVVAGNSKGLSAASPATAGTSS